jgi:Helix-turn-helix domain
MEGESAYYGVDVEEAARVLQRTPEQVREMLIWGELEGIPPGATAEGDWKVLLPATPDLAQPAPAADVPESPSENHEEAPADGEEAPGEFVEPPNPPPSDVEELPAREPADELSRGDDAAADREPTAPSGWVSTQQAARALGISPRTVRWHIEQGNLEAKPEGEGVRRSWLVSIDSLQSFRDARQAAGDMPRLRRASAEATDIAAESLGNPIRELADRLAEEAARAAEYRVRLELTEQAASTVRAELEEERHRREEAERERDELRRRLEARPEPPGAPSEAAAEPERAEPLSGSPGPQERVSRPWWRRMFGG